MENGKKLLEKSKNETKISFEGVGFLGIRQRTAELRAEQLRI
jgi:hypothetical protein